MDCTVLMKIISVKEITKDSPLWSHYLARYIDSGYQAEFECEGTADKWGIYDECKRLARTVLIFTERSEQLSRATDRVPGLPASPGYAQ